MSSGAVLFYSLDDVLSRKSESVMLAELDDDTIKEQLRELLFDSVKYTAFNRCGLESSDDDVFRNLYAFAELPISDILANAVSELSSVVLRDIEEKVKDIERSNQDERRISQNHKWDTSSALQGGYDILSDNEKEREDRFDVQARSRNVSLFPVPDGEQRHEERGNLGKQEREIPQREQAVAVYGDVRQSHADRPLDRDK